MDLRSSICALVSLAAACAGPPPHSANEPEATAAEAKPGDEPPTPAIAPTSSETTDEDSEPSPTPFERSLATDAVGVGWFCYSVSKDGRRTSYGCVARNVSGERACAVFEVPRNRRLDELPEVIEPCKKSDRVFAITYWRKPVASDFAPSTGAQPGFVVMYYRTSEDCEARRTETISNRARWTADRVSECVEFAKGKLE